MRRPKHNTLKIMNIEDIKVGEMLNIQLLCVAKVKQAAIFETPTGGKFQLGYCDFECINPENGTKNTENAPKYDPCRLFKKGDLVTPKKVNGRSSLGVNGEIYRVCQDELESGCEIKLVMDGCIGHVPVDAAYLELVTPVEEQKIFFYENEPELPYYCVHFGRPNNFEFVAHLDKEYYSKKQVQAECDRLNAAYRKEQI